MRQTAIVGKLGEGMNCKAQIAATFGQAASQYDRYAHLQRQYAEKLMAFLRAKHSSLPPGRILEIGCGTGFITQQLRAQFPDRALEITDLSPAMLAFCQQQMQRLDTPEAARRDRQPANLHFRQMDGEAMMTPPAPYAMIVTGFTIQWFNHPLAALQRYLEWLQPGGILLVAFPDDRSFPEWRLVCQERHLPFTGNPLPATQSLVDGLRHPAVQIQIQQEMPSYTYRCAADFFRGLKAIGVHYSAQGRRLTTAQFRQLLHDLDRRSQPVVMSYGITLLLAQVNPHRPDKLGWGQ